MVDGRSLDSVFADYNDLIEALIESKQITFSSIAGSDLKKIYLLSVASFYETVLVERLASYFNDKTNNVTFIKEFLINKALNRQYHTLFDWQSNNANKFFAFFGDEFKTFMKGKIGANEALEMSIKSFIEIGNERNRMVHNNFSTYSLEKTLKEVKEMHESASVFVENFTNYLEEFYQQGIDKSVSQG